MKKDNVTSVLAKFADQLNFPIKIQKVYDELLIHPNYPSLLAISDVLENFGISNSAFYVDNEQLADVPCPFLAHTNINNDDFIIVNKIDGDRVWVSNEKWNKHKIDLKEFNKIYKGIVLAAEEPLKPSTQNKIQKITANIKQSLLITGLVLVLVLSLLFHTNYIANLSWELGLLTIAKTTGLITSLLLLVQSIDSNNPLVKKLCETNGKTNCNAILSSSAAKVFDGLSWSEVGFFYFAGTWLLLLFSNNTNGIWPILFLLNVVSLPYTFYSIYYQARVAKQWCVFCCVIQAMLWLEFIPLVSHLSMPLVLPGNAALSSFIIAMLLPAISWILIKPVLLQTQQLHPLKQQLQQIKFNTEIFEKALSHQPKYQQPGEDWSIVLGNKEAKNIITMISSPYCPPCSEGHKALDELLDQRDDLQARIIFTAQNTDTDFKTPVSRHLMALQELPDKTIIKQAMHDWYGQSDKKYDQWAKKYPVDLVEANFSKLDKQKNWCAIADIVGTPVVLLNGTILPSAYQLSDLKYLLQ